MCELGVPQESLFYWGELGELKTEEEYYNFVDFANSVGKPAGTSIEKHYSAFTVAELGEMLPESIIFDGGEYRKVCRCRKTDMLYNIEYWNPSDHVTSTNSDKGVSV